MQARQSFEQAVATIEMLRAQAAGGELARRYFLEQQTRALPLADRAAGRPGQG